MRKNIMKKTILSTAIVLFMSGNVGAEGVADIVGIQPKDGSSDTSSIPVNSVSDIQGSFGANMKPVNADDVLRGELAKSLGINSAKKSEKQAQNTQKAQSYSVDYKIETGPVVKVKPSENKVIKIAVGMMNKIETPFYKVAVKTANAGTINTEGGMIFVSPDNTDPIGLIVREKGMNETMFSITLIPENIPPAMITMDLSMDEGLRTSWYDHVKEEKRSKSMEERKQASQEQTQEEKMVTDSYEATISGILKSIAKGDIPNGYEMRDAEYKYICDSSKYIQPYVAEVKQIIEGSKINISVGVVTNNTTNYLGLNEAACYKPGVLAVSSFPKIELAPGEKTEIYIVERREALTNDHLRKKLY
jgi:conjugal transfer pilus assembly protein TraK